MSKSLKTCLPWLRGFDILSVGLSAFGRSGNLYFLSCRPTSIMPCKGLDFRPWLSQRRLMYLDESKGCTEFGVETIAKSQKSADEDFSILRLSKKPFILHRARSLAFAPHWLLGPFFCLLQESSRRDVPPIWETIEYSAQFALYKDRHCALFKPCSTRKCIL